MKKTVIACDAHTVSGSPRFAGTRVPLWVFRDHLLGSPQFHEFVAEFLQDFPTVEEGQIYEAMNELMPDKVPSLVPSDFSGE